MSRGQLTEEIQKIAHDKMGVAELSTGMLRLIPYIQYRMINDRFIDSRHVNEEDQTAIDEWVEAGFISSPHNNMTVTKDFWDGMCEILWLSYAGGGQ